MQVTKEKNNGVLVVNVAGRLDASTAPQFEEDVMGDLADVMELYFDIENLEYISSAGLRILLLSHKTMANKRGKFVVRHPRDAVVEILEMTGFSDFLTIEK